MDQSNLHGCTLEYHAMVLVVTYGIDVSSVLNPQSVQLNSALVWPAFSRFLGERL